MSKRTLLLVGLLLFSFSTTFGQLGGLFDKAKKKAQETINEIKGTDPKSGATAAPPTSTGSSGQTSGSTAGAAKQAADPQTEPWPGLVIDPDLMASQQADLRKSCEEEANKPLARHDCSCLVSRFPDWWLRTLSGRIRFSKQRVDSFCSTDSGDPRCPKERQQFEWLTSKEAQDIRNSPPAINPNAPKPPKPKSQGFSRFNLILLTEGGRCVDATAIATEDEKTCLNDSNNLPPGASTKAYCACVKDERIRQHHDQQKSMNSKDMVDISSAAQVRCSKQAKGGQ